jgi:hypothetical protein
MKIYWSLKSVPEFSGMPASERREAWREWYGLVPFLPKVGVAFATVGVCWFSGAIIGDHFGHHLIGTAIGGGLGSFAFGQASVHMTLRYLRKARKGSS